MTVYHESIKEQKHQWQFITCWKRIQNRQRLLEEEACIATEQQKKAKDERFWKNLAPIQFYGKTKEARNPKKSHAMQVKVHQCTYFEGMEIY